VNRNLHCGQRRGNAGPWKSEENQTQVFLRFPPPLEIAPRFPHFHRENHYFFFSKTKERTTNHPSSSVQSFRPVLGLENAFSPQKPLPTSIQSLRISRGMAVQELPVNGLAPLKALFKIVPETDSGFAQLPAQAHIAILKAAEEVDQADIQVLEHRSGLLKLLQRVPDGGNAGVAVGADGLELALVEESGRR
jgi:hypothetical protein